MPLGLASLPTPLRRRDTLAALLAAAAVAILGSAWGFQLIGGILPCKLCLEQRIPYYVGIPLALLAVLADRLPGPRATARLLLVVLACLFAWGLWVGAYQAGAEWGWWPGPSDCSSTGQAVPTSAADLLAGIEKTKVIDCTKPQIRIAGLSFAGWNVLISLALIATALHAAFCRDVRSAHD